MECKCKNIEPQSKEAYDQMITVEIPAHMDKYKQTRIEAGLSSKISIDPCIFDEVQFLWDNGIITYGSCCGHNKYESFVNVDIKCVRKMVEMGYQMNHKDPERFDTFCLKGGEAERPDESSGLHLADVTGSALLNEVKQFRKEQQELHDFTKKEGHPKIAEYTEGGLDVCDKLIKIIEKHYR